MSKFPQNHYFGPLCTVGPEWKFCKFWWALKPKIWIFYWCKLTAPHKMTKNEKKKWENLTRILAPGAPTKLEKSKNFTNLITPSKMLSFSLLIPPFFFYFHFLCSQVLILHDNTHISGIWGQNFLQKSDYIHKFWIFLAFYIQKFDMYLENMAKSHRGDL